MRFARYVDDAQIYNHPTFSCDDIVRLEELAHRRPEPGLGYDLRVLLGEDGVELGDSDRLLGRRERLELGSELGDELLHADGRVLRVGDLGVVGVELRNGVNTCSGAAMNQRLTSTVRVVGIW